MAAGALAGALLLRADVALPVPAAAVVIALAAVALRFGRQEGPYALLRALGVALTAIPWSRWQLAVPLLDRRPAGI